METPCHREPDRRKESDVRARMLGTGFAEGDIRTTIPRFAAEAQQANAALVDLVPAVAERKGATPEQVQKLIDR